MVHRRPRPSISTSADGTRYSVGNALVAVTLLMAEDRPQDKNILAGGIVNLINKRNL